MSGRGMIPGAPRTFGDLLTLRRPSSTGDFRSCQFCSYAGELWKYSIRHYVCEKCIRARRSTVLPAVAKQERLRERLAALAEAAATVEALKAGRPAVSRSLQPQKPRSSLSPAIAGRVRDLDDPNHRRLPCGCVMRRTPYGLSIGKADMCADHRAQFAASLAREPELGETVQARTLAAAATSPGGGEALLEAFIGERK